MEIFRVAHFTDLHFGRVLNWLNPADSAATSIGAAKEAIRYLIQQGGRPGSVLYPSTFNPDAALGLLEWLADELPYLDAVLTTGDLATTGEAADLALARQFFAGQVPSAWSPVPLSLAVADADIPLLTLPGNHDRYGTLSQPQSPRFESFFGGNWDLDKNLAFPVFPSEDETGRVRLAAFELENSCLGIMCADLTLESTSSGTGAFGYVGQGRAAQRVLNELVAGTKAARNELRQQNRPFGIVWALHFPPSFPAVLDSLALLESENLLKAAADCGVTHIVAGHTHETLMYKVALATGPITVICSGPSSGVSLHGRYSFSVLEIGILNDGSTVVTPTAFSWQNFRFVKEKEFPGQ